jgi:hypothetical protein
MKRTLSWEGRLPHGRKPVDGRTTSVGKSDARASVSKGDDRQSARRLAAVGQTEYGDMLRFMAGFGMERLFQPRTLYRPGRVFFRLFFAQK